MKLFHEYEDCVIGLLVGLLMLGLSGYFFILPQINVLWGMLFTVSAILTLFDALFSVFDLGEQIVPLLLLFFNNLIDVLIEITLAAKYFGFSLYNIPLFSTLEYYLSQPLGLLIAGFFFIGSSVFWIIATPIIWKEKHKKEPLIKKKNEKKAKLS